MIKNKYIYTFREGNKDLKELLGGKGANLAEMTNLGLPVPEGFTITTEACKEYYNNHETLPLEVESQIYDAISNLEEQIGKRFGDARNPLLVSVRSGARASMPGMMDTILNLGLNDEVARVLANTSNNVRFVYDSYRRLIMMYANVVMGYDKDEFEKYLDDYKKERKYESDLDLDDEDMVNVTTAFKRIYKNLSGKDFPQEPKRQLVEAVKAVFRSWNNKRAVYYRKINDIPDDWGTAVNVERMVYGNLSTKSGTGVAFTRNPSTGEKGLFGEYLMEAQGEDVVSGARTPKTMDVLKEEMPSVYEKFYNLAMKLENHYKDMQDMEFTIEEGKLFMLQTRIGKRTSKAAIKIAVDQVKEGLITKEEAILRIKPEDLSGLLHKTFNEEDAKKHTIIGRGLKASPGAGKGSIYFSAKDAIEAKNRGENAVLIRLETSAEDVEGMHVCDALVTIRGGMTSHAAVVARGLGATCVAGCQDFQIDALNGKLHTKMGETLSVGDVVSVDGTNGIIYKGDVAMEDPEITGEFAEFMRWADAESNAKVYANADTEKDATIARNFGAKGIGLVRTEHMFFERDRIFFFRLMILSGDKETRKKALERILPYQQGDFEKLFRVMYPDTVTIRLLDPPLHEFLPKKGEETNNLANILHVSAKVIEDKVDSLKEINPMMGQRGLRLAVNYPEIYEMQAEAIIKAAINLKKENINVVPKIMIPLTSSMYEYMFVKDLIVKKINEVLTASNEKIKYQIGTMIETPRSALIAGVIANEADFFSFGTNDLTQMTYGFSRDDSEAFLKAYFDNNILKDDPFIHIDEYGVGYLIRMAIANGRKTNKELEIGVCGEHGGDAKSIAFLNPLGINYVSCSPYRVPIARLTLAQAAIRSGKTN